jgi:threonylcarbamoyladenosine tRNA methylthiotransferase MtaB
MDGKVSVKDRNRRADMLRILSEKKKRFFYEQNIGRTFNVLFEDDVKEGLMEGFTENYVRVVAKYDPILVNETKNVILTGINSNGLMEADETYQEVLQH